jgi:hypothetical protein
MRIRGLRCVRGRARKPLNWQAVQMGEALLSDLARTLLGGAGKVGA